MNDKYKEQLSAFIDNEIGPEELSNLEVSGSLLTRYRLIGDAIKGNLSDASLVDVSAQVSLALQDEPVYSADPVKTERLRKPKQSSPAPSWFDFGAWLRPVGGMAVAASVAIVMVMVMSQPETNDIGINGAGAQIAIDTRAVVSLPVNNLDRNMGDSLNTVGIETVDEPKEDLSKLKDKELDVNPQNTMNR